MGAFSLLRFTGLLHSFLSANHRPGVDPAHPVSRCFHNCFHSYQKRIKAVARESKTNLTT